MGILSIVLIVNKEGLSIVNTDKQVKMPRLQSSRDEDLVSPATPSHTSSDLESSQKEVASVTEDATVDIKKWKFLFEKSEAERKKLTEELSEEREKVRQAEKRVVELERDLNQSRLATEKANKDKDEAIKEAKIEATRMSKKIESFEKEKMKI